MILPFLLGGHRHLALERQHHDLEQVRALLGHARIDTKIYTSIRPPQLKRAMSFYEEKAVRILSE